MTTISTSSSGLVLTAGSFTNPIIIDQGVTIHNTTANSVGISTTGNTQPVTIVNNGSIVAGYAIELHGAGSTITNSATGFISATGGGFGVRFDIGADDGTVVNAGTIRSTNHSGVAFLSTTSGGFVTNSAGGLITGFTNGVYTEGGVTIVNAGSIAGIGVTPTTDGFGVNFKFGTGNILTNASTGTITGANVGVYGGATAFSPHVTNSGQITGPNAIELKDGGVITNLPAGKITGTSFGIDITTAAGTVTNAGTIRATGSTGIAINLAAGGTVAEYGTVIGNGGTAIYLGGGALTNNLLILKPGYSISGVVEGGTASSNTLQLAAGTGGAGTLTGLGTEFNNFGVSVAASANWVLTGNNTMTGGGSAAATYLGGAGTLTNTGYLTARISAGQVFGSETIAIGSFINDGTIGVGTYDELSLTTGVATGNGQSGTIVIGHYGILETGAAVSSGQTIVFADNTGELAVDDTTDFAGSIAGMQAGDTLELNNLVFSTDSTAVLSGDTLTVTTGSGSARFVMDGVAPGTRFTTQQSGDGGVDVTQAIACFGQGTLIETDQGQVPVEDLKIGDRVVTLAGATRAVRWIGYRSFDLTRHPAPERVQPIRIAANAFADGVPSRSLRLSPDHAVLLDGLLIPAKLLRNDTTIVRETACQSVTYYHIELDTHDVLLAEGLPAESYLDTGNRNMFENAGQPLLLHPDFNNDQGRRESESCRPFAADPIRVEPIHRALVARAVSVGLMPPARPDVTADPALCVATGPRMIRPVSHHGGRAIFVLPDGSDPVRLISRSVVPNALNGWVDDWRRLGVPVVRLTLRSGGLVETIPLDHPGLASGWWDIERDGSQAWRWTSGDAIIPLNGAGPTILEVQLAGTPDYPVEAAPEAASRQPRAVAA